MIYIVFLRGINVGGKNRLPMKELRDSLVKSGFTNVKSYIQSGNIILQSDLNEKQIKESIEALIHENFSLSVASLVLNHQTLVQALENCPYLKVAKEEKQVHFFFSLSSIVELPEMRLQELKASDEEYCQKEGVFYFYAPSGIGRSKIAGKVEGLLKVSLTARNLRTVRKVLEMVDA